MWKRKEFKGVKFASEIISLSITAFREASKAPKELAAETLQTSVDGSDWGHDSFDEFLADYTRCSDASIHIRYQEFLMSITYYDNSTLIKIGGPTRQIIEQLFARFEHAVPKIRIFIGHGGDPAWRDLKDHLQDKHSFKVEAYEVGARAGHSITEVLFDMLKSSSFAILVMTGEDATPDGVKRARQNVIHEVGLFQGKLGFSKAIVLLESGTEEFSNIAGLQQVRFKKGNIRETFGDVLATIRREYPHTEHFR